LLQHLAPSRSLGVTDAQCAALDSGEIDAAHFNPQELAALQLAAAVQAGPSSFSLGLRTG
jgi:alkylhydroperoxidase family enzyme